MQAYTKRVTTDSYDESLLASHFLERALLFTIVAHIMAMVSMALLLLPGMPGGNPLEARITYLATNTWLWRLGWFPWHLSALSDLLLAIALLRTAWIPRYPALFVLLTTVAAVLIEQPGEFSWSIYGVNLAQAAIENGNLAPYLEFETKVYPQVAGVAAALYVVSACGWTWCFVEAKLWSRPLTWLSCLAWGLLFVVSLCLFLPMDYRPNHEIIAAGNAIGFILMMLWFAALTELVLRRSRPSSQTGRMAVWTYPRHNFLSPIFNFLAESRLARAFGEYMPPVAFRSDITNVIYVNYLVEAECLIPLLPIGLELQCLGTDKKYSLFTHLSYQHGHFGPRFLGPLRAFMPSPVQSNWRLYVYDPRTNCQGIYFVTTAINQTLPALLARVLSEGLPMHLLAKGAIIAEVDGSFHVHLDPGTGSAPDLMMHLKASSEPILSPPWNLCFDNFHELLAYCVPQDRGMSSQPWYSRTTRQEIELPIPLDSCESLTGTVVSQAAEKIAGNSEAICFRVPKLAFLFKREEYDYWEQEI
jgi:hypothetical protein